MKPNDPKLKKTPARKSKRPHRGMVLQNSLNGPSLAANKPHPKGGHSQTPRTGKGRNSGALLPGARLRPRPLTLRRAWTEVVSPDDYEAHMIAVGQSLSNAELVQAMITKWPPSSSRMLVAGAGTGQMLDHLDATFLDSFQITFTDINPRFLSRLSTRLGARSPHRILVDDLEESALSDTYGGVVAVLVLEHIDWEIGVASLAKVCEGRCYIVIQKNPHNLRSALTPSRAPVGSMRVFRAVLPSLVPREALVRRMGTLGFRMIGRASRSVLDGKKMLGFVFERSRGQP